MSINPDIKRAIEVIDRRIESLKQIRDNLAREFGMDAAMQSAAPSAAMPLPFAGLAPAMTSKNKIAAYLEQHAPASRKQISIGTGIPDGTVSFALNDKTRFRRTDAGWVIATEADHTANAAETTPKPDNADNKSEIARQFFREQGTNGGTPRELKTYLVSKGAGDNDKFVYSAISRMKKQGQIELRGDRYYPTENLPLAPKGLVLQ